MLYVGSNVWSIGPPSTPWWPQGASATFLAAFRQSSPRLVMFKHLKHRMRTNKTHTYIQIYIYILIYVACVCRLCNCKCSAFKYTYHMITCILESNHIQTGNVWSIYEYITFYIGYACSRFANQLFRTQTSGITHSSHTCVPHRQRNIWMHPETAWGTPHPVEPTTSRHHSGPSTCTTNLSHEAQIFSLWRKHLPSCERAARKSGCTSGI